MRVSVVVPTRNRPGQLATALAAIAAQEHAAFDIIVVDDGSSPDNARANAQQLERLACPTRHIYLSGDDPRGSGPSRARNVGLAATDAALVAFCDDDDEWCDATHLTSAAAAFERRAELDVFFGNQATHVEGRPALPVWLPLLVERLGLAATPDGSLHTLSKAQALIDHFPHMNSCVFRREILIAAGGFWEDVRYCEDMDLYVRAVDVAREILYHHQTVCIHHVPDPKARASASSRLDTSEKDLCQTAVAHHLLATCSDAQARHYARRLAGFAYRRLALAAFAANRPAPGLDFARLGQAIWPTPRWAGYTLWKGFVGRLRGRT